MRPQIIVFVILMLLANHSKAEDAKLTEGSVDACYLIKEKDFKEILKTSPSSSEKGSIPISSGSACSWKFTKSNLTIKLAAHTKYAEQTYKGLKKRFGNVKDHPDIGEMVYESDGKYYLLKRGVYFTFEQSSGIAYSQLKLLLQRALDSLDELARLQEVHK